MAQIFLTGQNFDIYEGGGKDAVARTGSISIEMLEKAGAEGVIIGHSEVGDSINIVSAKITTLLHYRDDNPSLLPHSTIMVGESWEEFTGRTIHQIAEIVSEKLFLLLSQIPQDFAQTIVTCYEPQWGSRGSGHDNEPPPSPELISTVAAKMKDKVLEIFGPAGKTIPLIYGGRSTPDRTEEILADKHIDGLILGSACNTVQKTLDIAHAMQRAMLERKKVLHANFKAYNLTDSYELYVQELSKLDDTFIVYISPNHTDIRIVKEVLDKYLHAK